MNDVTGRVIYVQSTGNCPRCGQAHGALAFLPLERPISRKGIVTHTHWTMCPLKVEPLLVVCDQDNVPAPADVPMDVVVVRTDGADSVPDAPVTDGERDDE